MKYFKLFIILVLFTSCVKTIRSDFDSYNDKIVLNKNRAFEVVQGVPSLDPIDPKDKDDAMTLYILHHPYNSKILL